MVFLLIMALAVWAIDRWYLRKWDIAAQLKEGNMAVAVVFGAFIFGMFLFAGLASGAEPNRDRVFKKAVHLYWSTSIPWELSKAQGMAESGLRTHVCSPVGACGLMQFMPGTARQFKIDPFNDRQAIYAANRYMRWLWGQWSAPRPPLDRYYLALGSYNWGLGNMLKAQAKRERARLPGRLWADLESILPKETAEYSPRISRWCLRYRGSKCLI